ncbi:hypothetical protein [Vagococcus fluvialis]|uniref:hypothetical protein n=1 Tax=Vagococcus fluvialis TaxID=2738 RepID=UPI0037A4AAE9
MIKTELQQNNEALIFKYLSLSKNISKCNKKKKRIRSYFYQQSFTPCIYYDGQSVKNISLKIDKEVVRLIDTLDMLSLIKKILQKKQYYFKSFFDNLSNDERKKIYEKYKQQNFRNIAYSPLDELIIDEILEIEEAISYQFDYLFEKEMNEKDSNEIEDEFENMLLEMGL